MSGNTEEPVFNYSSPHSGSFQRNNQSASSNNSGRNDPRDLNKQFQFIKAAVDAKTKKRNRGRRVDEPANKVQRITVFEELEDPVLGKMTSRATQTESELKCEYCDVIFSDDAMHAVHMSCHLPQDPFKCKQCGEK